VSSELVRYRSADRRLRSMQLPVGLQSWAPIATAWCQSPLAPSLPV